MSVGVLELNPSNLVLSSGQRITIHWDHQRSSPDRLVRPLRRLQVTMNFFTCYRKKQQVNLIEIVRFRFDFSDV